MYYNSNKYANDYYNSYKREMRELKAYEKEKRVHQLIKIIFLVTLLIIFILADYFLYKYFNPNIQVPQITEQTKNSKIKSNKEETTTISQKEIALIVQTIMEQVDTQKETSLEEQLITAESTKSNQKELKETNYYNKVILNNTQQESSKNSNNEALVELTDSINHILEQEPVENKIETQYSTSIKEEVAYRENEMRVIIVKKGDTLSRIAKRAYGDSKAYPKIFLANPEIIKNPDQIYEGMRLRIPS